MSVNQKKPFFSCLHSYKYYELICCDVKLKQVKTAKLVGIFNVGFVGVVIAITLLAMHGKMRLTFVGILCAALTIGMYASPLAVMVINN